jgi:hypothetical protein
MKQSEDIVWNTITESAKNRFDYENFREVFAEMGNDTVPENVLFMTIVGHAAGHSADEITAEIKQSFTLIAYSLDEDYLRKFIEDRRSDLFREIEAAKQALAFYEMGLQTPGILVQVRSILREP